MRGVFGVECARVGERRVGRHGADGAQGGGEMRITGVEVNG